MCTSKPVLPIEITVIVPLFLALVFSATSFAAQPSPSDILLQAANGNRVLNRADLNQVIPLIGKGEDELVALMALDVAANPSQNKQARKYLIIATIGTGNPKLIHAALVQANAWAYDFSGSDPAIPDLVHSVVYWLTEDPSRVPIDSTAEAANLIASYFRKEKNVIAEFAPSLANAILSLPLEDEFRSDLAARFIIKYYNWLPLAGCHQVALILDEPSKQKLRTNIKNASLEAHGLPMGPLNVLVDLGDTAIIPELKRRRADAAAHPNSHEHQYLVGYIDYAIMSIELQQNPEDLLVYASDPSTSMAVRPWAFMRYLELGGDKQRAKDGFVQVLQALQAEANAKSLHPMWLATALDASHKVLVDLGAITQDDFPEAQRKTFYITNEK